MEIKDIQARQGNIDVVFTIVSKDEPRTFDKFGKEGRVCNAKGKDESGEITLTLWNEQIDQVNIGDKVHIENGWCSEYRDERQLSTGKFGKLDIVEKAVADTVMTNDPSILAGNSGELAAGEDVPEVLDDEEEIIG
ncbi:MAG: hypothetical protein KKH52_03365 [Nanoarchaeota archaeon]|nr:hypothetical protein [Nanoarchaeota archaeon]MBU1623339.1 hypothetical protein [Nanoarchaeota archaeon]MBU1974407.1 hypothetical protein [Nanoarchaeota archaeon]